MTSAHVRLASYAKLDTLGYESLLHPPFYPYLAPVNIFYYELEEMARGPFLINPTKIII